MKKNLVLLFVGLSFSLLTSTSFAEDTEAKPFNPTDAKVCFQYNLRGYGSKCVDERSLQDIQAKIAATDYDSETAITQAIARTNEALSIEKGYDPIRKKISRIAGVVTKKSLFTRLFDHGGESDKEKGIAAIDAQILHVDILDALLHSATHDIIKYYSAVEGFRLKKAAEFEEEKGDADKRAEIEAELVAAEAIKKDLSELLRREIAKTDLEFTDTQIQFLARSKSGHEELKLMLIAANMEKFVLSLKKKIDDIQNGQSETVSATAKSIRAAEFLAMYAFFIRMVNVSMDAYGQKIEDSIIPKVEEVIKVAKEFKENNPTAQEEVAKNNDKVIEIGEKYVAILKARRESLATNSRKTALKDMFDQVAQNYHVTVNAQTLVSTVEMSETMNGNLEDLLGSDLLNMVDDEGANDLTFQALLQIEDKI